MAENMKEMKASAVERGLGDISLEKEGNTDAKKTSPFLANLSEDEVFELEKSGEGNKESPKAAMDAVLRLFIEDEKSGQVVRDEEDEDDGEGEIGEVSLACQQRRTEKLRGITLALDQLYWAGQSELAKAADQLANGSRDRKCLSSVWKFQ